MYINFTFFKKGAVGPVGPPGPRGLPGNVVCKHQCICFLICALVSLFNVLIFLPWGFTIRFKRLCFITLLFFFESKDVEAPGNGVSMKHIFIFICNNREAWKSFTPLQIVKKHFFLPAPQEKNYSVYCLFGFVSFTSFPFVLSFWKHDYLISRLHSKLLYLLWKYVNIRSYNQCLEDVQHPLTSVGIHHHRYIVPDRAFHVCTETFRVTLLPAPPL